MESLWTGARRYSSFLDFSVALCIHASIVVLRRNFSGRADRPIVPNHNNMLNYYYYCRLRLYNVYYIIVMYDIWPRCILCIYIILYIGAHHAWVVSMWVEWVSQWGGKLSVRFWNQHETKTKKRVPTPIFILIIFE